MREQASARATRKALDGSETVVLTTIAPSLNAIATSLYEESKKMTS
jgi:hypothetical protein